MDFYTTFRWRVYDWCKKVEEIMKTLQDLQIWIQALRANPETSLDEKIIKSLEEYSETWEKNITEAFDRGFNDGYVKAIQLAGFSPT